MTYHNRVLTTPYYINNFRSTYWNYVAQDTAYRCNEACPHSSNIWNISVKCTNANEKVSLSVTCIKCDQVFSKTEKFLVNMIGYTGF